MDYLTIWPLLTTRACVEPPSRAQSNPRIMKKTFLLMSSAKDVMAGSPRVTCPWIALTTEFQGSDLTALCVPVCVCQEWPDAGGWWMEMSRCSRRHMEAGGNRKEGGGGKDYFHHIIIFWRIQLKDILETIFGFLHLELAFMFNSQS